MRLFAWEIRKLAGDSAARAGLFVLAAALLLALAGAALSRGEETRGTVSEIQAAGELPVPPEFRKGLGFASFILAPVAGLLIPAIIFAALAGTIAGEAESGTLAEALARPVARWKLAWAKLGAGLAYAAALVLVTALVALVVAPLLLGTGKLMTGLSLKMSSDAGLEQEALLPVAESLSGGEAVLRLAAAYAFSFLALFPAVALVVLASALADRARTASALAAGVYFGLCAVSRLPALGSLKRYLIVDRMGAWQKLIKPEVEGGLLFSGVVLLVAFALLGGAAALILNGREAPPRAGNV